MRRLSRARDDAGAATVLAAVLVAVVLAVALGGIALGAAIVARHRAQAAADLAALAAAAGLPAGPALACRLAVDIAAAGGAILRDCTVADLDVVVVVGVDAGARLGEARAVARAGPVRTG